ncbi:GDSL-type esterase/lipase family protein [Paenibacillus sp. 32352]|uniref:GDSL-type esterase/lipase family protein n=1 Tax=Paenibacillus sp. 32352 TaxID=1969111 RepID=UPI0009AEAF21|nr:GDSL-type esterase/lipase family protein [Paenibacillus sp. 32352]
MTTKTEPLAKKFYFGKSNKAGYIRVNCNENNGVPLYSKETSFGFLHQTCAFPPREVHTSSIISTEEGFILTETDFYYEPGHENDNFNHYGMAFRIDVPAGAYEIYVKTASELADTMVSVSGLQASRILDSGYWDAARLIPVNTYARTGPREWSFRFVTGLPYLDIEIEPKYSGIPVGVEEIIISPIAPQPREEGSLPALFLLGDSTVKSYTFEEAPMCGWGQVIGRLFDRDQVSVINYSMGGRSFKNAYAEGRLNDLLMTGHQGDHVLIQFGHNDERKDEYRRYGRGSTESTYRTYIEHVYVPAIRARGMIPVLVTPPSRVLGTAAAGHRYTNSFRARKFPELMKALGQELGITVIDLNSESIQYYNQIGVEAPTALFMSIEAGETPGKTNDGSYANGHPANKIDGTHYKEALAKPFAQIIATQMVKLGEAGDPTALELASYLRKDVAAAAASEDWETIFPETAKDIRVGEAAYYRNQIEKMLQLGVMNKDHNGHFHPHRMMSTEEFITALSRIMNIQPAAVQGYPCGDLTREVMAAILFDAYHAKFTEKPKYMTDYNGKPSGPADRHHDPNLDSGNIDVTYDPMISYEQLTDTGGIAPNIADKVKKAYELGLIRSEKGITRGKVSCGTELEPKQSVTREKAAKVLYFMWVLVNPVHRENHQI